jgi:hypothetical protein
MYLLLLLLAWQALQCLPAHSGSSMGQRQQQQGMRLCSLAAHKLLQMTQQKQHSSKMIAAGLLGCRYCTGVLRSSRCSSHWLWYGHTTCRQQQQLQHQQQQ